MMTVALAVLGLFCLMNLLLTVGVIRRLRDHTTVLGLLNRPQIIRPAGETVDEFSATAVDGTTVGRGMFASPTLVGFVSPTCGPCHERLPDFIARARASSPDRVLAVVVTAGEETAGMLDRLSKVATVVLEPPGGQVAQAFGVLGYPAFCLVDGAGMILASGTMPSTLPMALAA
ncbi:MAG TPA: TlpA disulfide reductase family protein [Micromonosporaceae bacterium]